MAEFPSVVDAVQAAVEIQEALKTANEAVPEDRQVRFRIGVHVGDVLVKGGDLFGDGVNIAARLQALAAPGGTCISGAAYEHVRKALSLTYTDLGPHQVKNIADPLRAYSIEERSGAASSSSVFNAPPLPEKPSIAVLPFANLSGGPEQEYFADGVVEDIITALSRLRWLIVVARSSSFMFKGKAVDVKDVGRQLGVRYVLVGSIRRAGDRVRIAGQLIEAATGSHVWTERYDRDLSDIFQLQDEIAGSVVAATEPSLRAVEIARARAKPTHSLDAYDLYLRALSELAVPEREGLRVPRSICGRPSAAILTTPMLSRPLATALCGRCSGLFSRIGTGQRGKHVDLSWRALRADPENGFVLANAAWAFSLVGGSAQEVVELADRALQLQPYSALVRHHCAAAYAFAGEHARAIEHFHVARRLSPIDPQGHLNSIGLAVCHYFLRKFEECIAWARRALERAPENNAARRFLAAALAQTGQLEEARAVVAEILRTQPNASLTRAQKNNFSQPWKRDLYIEGLRKAGLPE